MDAHDLRARMRPHRNRLERYATPAMAALIEDMIIAAILEPVVISDAEAPRNETHDSIDAKTGMLTAEAAARRAELKAKSNKQMAAQTENAMPDPYPAAGNAAWSDQYKPLLVKDEINRDGPYQSEDVAPHSAVEAANRELAKAVKLTPETL